MSKPVDPPAWLADFQERFSSVLRTPLDRSEGRLSARQSAYSAEACADGLPGRSLSERERLAVYNRQYWFRLLSALQHELRLTASLLGSWRFNGHAAAFLEHNPPRERDIARAADGFSTFLEAVLTDDPQLPKRALVQAARLDDAFRTVLRAPEQPRFVLDASTAAALDRRRLIASPAVCMTQEDWPLMKLRDALREPSEHAVALPEAHAQTQHWALGRTRDGLRVTPLEPLQAELLRLLREHTLGEALARLEHAHGRDHDLPVLTQRWLADGMRLGFWSGIA